MLTQEQTVEIRVLARQGHSIRHIARTLGVSRNTVRRYLRDPSVARYQPREPRPANWGHLNLICGNGSSRPTPSGCLPPS